MTESEQLTFSVPMNKPPAQVLSKYILEPSGFHPHGSLDISRFNLAFCRFGYPVPSCFLLSVVGFLSSGIFTLHGHSDVANRI